MTKEEIALELFRLTFNGLKIFHSESPAKEAANQFNLILENLKIPGNSP